MRPFQLLASIAPEGADVRVTWRTGLWKTNALQATESMDGEYRDIFTVTNALSSVTNYLDVGALANGTARYYRVRLVP